MTTSSLPAARFEDRLRRAQLLLPENDASALLIGWGTDLLWLTGYEAAASERLTMLVLPAEGKRDAGRAAPRAIHGGSLTGRWRGQARCRDVGGDGRPIRPRRPTARRGRQPAGNPAGRARGQRGASWAVCWSRIGCSRPSCCACRTPFRTLPSDWRRPCCRISDRSRTPTKSSLLRQAAHAADRVVEAIAAGRLVGRTELDVAQEVGRRLVDEGHRRPSSPSSAAGPTRRRRITRRASASSVRASRSCSTSAAGWAAITRM